MTLGPNPEAESWRMQVDAAPRDTGPWAGEGALGLASRGASLPSRMTRAPFAQESPTHACRPGLTTDFKLTINFPISLTLLSALVWVI